MLKTASWTKRPSAFSGRGLAFYGCSVSLSSTHRRPGGKRSSGQVRVDVEIAVAADVRFRTVGGPGQCVRHVITARGQADERWREGGAVEITQESAPIDSRHESP
jgi:hypothetical protein